MATFFSGIIRMGCYAGVGGFVGFLAWRLFDSAFALLLGGGDNDAAFVGVVLGALTGALMSSDPYPDGRDADRDRAGSSSPLPSPPSAEPNRRRVVAELFGTFALVFAGTAAVVVNEHSGSLSQVGVALAFGLAALVLIHALGGPSVAHLNPAVTLGFFLARRFPGRWLPSYALGQCTGAVLASCLLRLVFPGDPRLGATHPTGAAAQSFFLEASLTLLLMFVLLSVAPGSRDWGGAVAAGAMIALGVLVAGPISGGSINPARSLGPALVTGRLDDLWVYLAAPPLGVGLAVLTCGCVHGRPCCCAAANQLTTGETP